MSNGRMFNSRIDDFHKEKRAQKVFSKGRSNWAPRESYHLARASLLVRLLVPKKNDKKEN